MKHKLLTLKPWPIFALFSGSLFSINDELPLNKKNETFQVSSFLFCSLMTSSRSGNLNKSNNKKERQDQSLQTTKFNYLTHFTQTASECLLNFQSFKFLMFLSLNLQWNNAARQFLQIIYF